MKPIKEIYQLAFAFQQYRDLSKIAAKLSRLDVAACNYGATPADDKKETRLIAAAQEHAARLGLIAYHQGDPRGCALYLIDETMDETTYDRGIAIV